MVEVSQEELMYASPEDWQLFNKSIENLSNRKGQRGNYLDKYDVEIPYSSGPHNLRWFREAIEIVKPKEVLEIGFNLGYSAAMMLAISDINLTSVDISDKEETLHSAKELERQYPDRFEFILSDSGRVKPLLGDWKFDLIFIDGGHNEPEVTKDIELAQQMGITYLLFDDIYPRFGPGVVPAIQKFPLELVKDMNNLWLMKFSTPS